MPTIDIEPRVGGGPVVTIEPCDGVSIVMTMPNGVRVFHGNDVRGLEGGGHSLTIHDEEGLVEYMSPDAEYNINLPVEVADAVYAALANLEGQPLEDEIHAPEDEEEDAPPEPNPAVEAVDEDPRGGRKRRSRVKKQTRRTKGKGRKTIRKKL